MAATTSSDAVADATNDVLALPAPQPPWISEPTWARFCEVSSAEDALQREGRSFVSRCTTADAEVGNERCDRDALLRHLETKRLKARAENARDLAAAKTRCRQREASLERQIQEEELKLSKAQARCERAKWAAALYVRQHPL
mmetsp:Transcript_42937/g.64972  ORF Transcript_42937/g.64972 Transcript_42937/m.64972 type:complete len:142 (+) Transcript_42937:23-448(+)